MTPAVLMCGGRGERLHALTKSVPKPLLNVGDKPMLHSIIDDLRNQGFKKIWLCVHYKADLIESYFGDGSKFGVKIKYTHEPEPMLTGGALHYVPKFNVPFIVRNADVLTNISYGHLMGFHGERQAQATMCLALYQHQVPFGVAEVEDTRLLALHEKPIQNYLINGGIYVLDPVVFDKLPSGPFDMTDLLDSLDHVAAYPIHDYWRDVGRFEDLEEARAAWTKTQSR